jgi:hypothetical protein
VCTLEPESHEIKKSKEKIKIIVKANNKRVEDNQN